MDVSVGVPVHPAKEKPPINVVGDVGGRIAIMVVSVFHIINLVFKLLIQSILIYSNNNHRAWVLGMFVVYFLLLEYVKNSFLNTHKKGNCVIEQFYKRRPAAKIQPASAINLALNSLKLLS